MIFKWFRKLQRKHDIILWKACKEEAGDIHIARMAFLFHCLNDDAWLKDYSEDEIRRMVGEMT